MNEVTNLRWMDQRQARDLYAASSTAFRKHLRRENEIESGAHPVDVIGSESSRLVTNVLDAIDIPHIALADAGFSEFTERAISLEKIDDIRKKGQQIRSTKLIEFADRLEHIFNILVPELLEHARRRYLELLCETCSDETCSDGCDVESNDVSDQEKPDPIDDDISEDWYLDDSQGANPSS
jgi:hypothetical protein